MLPSLCRQVQPSLLIVGLFLLLIPTGLLAIEPPVPILLDETVEQVSHIIIREHQLLFYDDGKKINPQEINERDGLPWRAVEEGIHPAGDAQLWMKLAFRNIGEITRHDYLQFNQYLDNMEAFVYQNDRLVDRADSEALRSLPGIKAALPLSLGPGEEQTVYLRGDYKPLVPEQIVVTSTLRSSKYTVYRRVTNHAYQFLYAGLMLGMVLISLFLFFVFRDWSFIFFSVMSVGFIFFFSSLYRVEGWVSYRSVFEWGLQLTGLALLMIIFGATGFIYKHIGLNLRNSWLGWLLILSAISYFLLTGVHSIIINQPPVLVLSSNIIGFIWILMMLMNIGVKARKGMPGARVLLYSTILLFVFVLCHVVAIIILMDENTFGGLFQFGTVVFSGIVFIGLYDKVLAIRNRATVLATQQNFTNRFFTNISHEFRTPLTLMLGPVQQLLDGNPKPSEEKLLKIVQRNAKRQLGLVNEIMELSRLQATQLLLNAQAMDVVPLLRRISHGYDSLAERRNISLEFKSDVEALVLQVEPNKLETVCHNLLSNAFRFTPDGGEISLSVTLGDNRAVITVRDTGRGIAPAALPNVFNRFYLNEEHKQTATFSSGVGLDLTRELVLLHGGEISVESKPGVATVFTVSLPYEPGLEIEVEAQVITEDINQETPLVDAEESQERAVPFATPGKKDAPLVVIVEDNADMRSYLAGSLISTYRVRLAKDGREGLALIRELTPDLVISDVMMPEMDGMEMCHAIKTELAISHIPVILLTARSAPEDRLEGLHTGADDYLTKPFDAGELLARARNLIASRRLLRERFASSITLKPEEVATTSIDQEFLQNALRVVEENMDNVSLSVEDLARELHQSKTGLNRKFRALLDQSTNEFIRNVRLERAVDLLKNSDMTVAQIAMESGFNSTSYFIRRFRDKFGETPGDFRKGEATDPVGVDPD